MSKDITHILELLGTIEYVCKNCMGSAGIKTIYELNQIAANAVENLSTEITITKSQPTHFTIIEGNDWIEWHNRGFSNTKTAHAIKFEGGAIFDMVNGWRNEAQSIETLYVGIPKPYAEEFGDQILGQDKPSIPDCAFFLKDTNNFYSHLTGHCMGANFFNLWRHRANEFPKERKIPELRHVSTDQRVVPRALLETVLDRLLYFGRGDIGIDDVDKFHSVIKELQQTLQTEKSELKASSPIKDVCTSYRSLIYRGICQNCGNSREAHSG